MPILIKGSGGAQEKPVITVSSSGLITATAGDEKTTKQLSSADDSDFIAGNIKKNANIFGVAGTLAAEGHVITAIAYGDGSSSSIQFSFSSLPSVDKIVSVFLFHSRKSIVDDSAVVCGWIPDSGFLDSTGMGLATNIGNVSSALVSYENNIVTITNSSSEDIYTDRGRYELMVSYVD